MTRRGFLGGLAALPALRAASSLAPWQPGFLDIHHIATGRGSCTFLLLPDGTTMMIDAGATADALDVSAPPMPNASRRPGQWMAAYAALQMKAAGRSELDYFLVSHFHPDHIGGLTDVYAALPIRKLVDRGYTYPAPISPPYTGLPPARKFEVGSEDQFRLRSRDYPAFSIRNIAANGQVWDGGKVRQCFPPLESLKPSDYPTENMCSAAIRVSYERFTYYSGGDLTCATQDGAAPWRDIETPVAEAVGPVSVAAANHHGYYDAVGPGFIQAMRPKAIVIPTWHISHPGMAQLERMVESGASVYATNMTAISRLLNERFVPRMKSTQGHIIVRVRPNGEFAITVLDAGKIPALR
jgi:glyoxylase-like metal-dependent hydrolase (beta-lactamase superfamily II)